MCQLGFFEEIGFSSNAESPLNSESNTGTCHFCQGELKQIAPRGWLCQSSDRHQFWLLNESLGCWYSKSGEPGGLVSGNSLPDWAVPCSWVAVGVAQVTTAWFEAIERREELREAESYWDRGDLDAMDTSHLEESNVG